MCGRYSFAPNKKQKKSLPSGAQEPLVERYNIAPTQQAYVLTAEGMEQMQWGLIPHWSADGKNGGSRINARSESLAEKPSFSEAFERRRCVVPADSFYEWRKEANGSKTPFRIFDPNGDLLWLAGLWDEWRGLRSFTIITTPPNLEMSELHNRMPALLTPDKARIWISDPNTADLRDFLRPAPDHTLERYAVSTKLNKPGYDAPDLHERVEPPLTLF